MSDEDLVEQEKLQFFAAQKKEKRGDGSLSLVSLKSLQGLETSSLKKEGSEDWDNTCLTLRLLQNVCRCGKKKELWEPSQGNVFKAHEVEETKYPLVLKILQTWNIVDILFVGTCLASVFLFFFSIGFLMKSKFLWGLIHINNALYTLGLFAQWLRILMTSKYSKTNQGYTITDVVLSLITVLPLDLVILAVYTLNKKEVDTPTDSTIICFSRLNYLFRIYYVFKYFAALENGLVVRDSVMFLIRTTLYSVFLIHIYACIWHRIACKSFALKHFLMTPEEATRDICGATSWIQILLRQHPAPLLTHPRMNVLGTHYFASIYWATTIIFGLGLGDISVLLSSNWEVVYTAITQITAWIFTLAVVNGTLTSLLVEGDTDRASFLTRRFAIKNYLDFIAVGKEVVSDVKNFYDYLWLRRKGIMDLELIESMARTMKAEVFYDINKFVFDQLPLVRDMEQPFLMSLSVYMKLTFHLAGEILYKRNETGDRMRYVLKGYLEILSEDESRVIAHIRSGSAIGEVHLIHPYPHVATVRCGSDSDILVLTKSNFKKLKKMYPEHWNLLRERMQERFDQSELLLSLCDKHNEYPKAFSKVHSSLQPSAPQQGVGVRQTLFSGPAIQTVAQFQSNSGDKRFKDIDDYDGVDLGEETIHRLSVKVAGAKAKTEKREKRQKILEDEAFKALETDIMRAGSLAKDLGIPRPPLFVTAPLSRSTPVMETKSFTLKAMQGKRLSLVGRIWTAVLALIVIWYYLYAVAFRSHTTVIITFIFHVTDIFFAVNFWLDMTEIVVTPQSKLLYAPIGVSEESFLTGNLYSRQKRRITVNVQIRARAVI